MRKFLIYKTTNTKNKKYYIGAHETENENDSYLGSGKALKRAIKKYGKEVFIKEIIFECASAKEMFKIEEELIEKHIKNPLCYNIKRGGVGGWDYVNSLGLAIGDKNPMKNPDYLAKCVEASRITRNKNPEKYKKISLENLKKATEKNIGSKRSESFKKNTSKRSKKYWKKNKTKMRDALSSWFVVVEPNGREYKTNRLEEFCIDKKLPYTTLWKTSKSGISAKRGPVKGWLCKQITQI
jgi:hypothetical protein